jgi:hypothetical protein
MGCLLSRMGCLCTDFWCEKRQDFIVSICIPKLRGWEVRRRSQWCSELINRLLWVLAVFWVDFYGALKEKFQLFLVYVAHRCCEWGGWFGEIMVSGGAHSQEPFCECWSNSFMGSVCTKQTLHCKRTRQQDSQQHAKKGHQHFKCSTINHHSQQQEETGIH